ncbi:Protein of unknown function, partial [Gryllus bimaculatus]
MALWMNGRDFGLVRMTLWISACGALEKYEWLFGMLQLIDDETSFRDISDARSETTNQLNRHVTRSSIDNSNITVLPIDMQIDLNDADFSSENSKL